MLRWLRRPEDQLLLREPEDRLLLRQPEDRLLLRQPEDRFLLRQLLFLTLTTSSRFSIGRYFLYVAHPLLVSHSPDLLISSSLSLSFSLFSVSLRFSYQNPSFSQSALSVCSLGLGFLKRVSSPPQPCSPKPPLLSPNSPLSISSSSLGQPWPESGSSVVAVLEWKCMFLKMEMQKLI